MGVLIVPDLLDSGLETLNTMHVFKLCALSASHPNSGVCVCVCLLRVSYLKLTQDIEYLKTPKLRNSNKSKR